jgi:hypothetical protein
MRKKEVFYIEDGVIKDNGGMCDHCEYFLKNLVGECNVKMFKRMSEWKMQPFRKTDLFGMLIEIKKGYVKERDFSKNVLFTKKNITENIDVFKKRGGKAKGRNKIRREICIEKKCVKYRSAICRKGWQDYKTINECFVDKEMIDGKLIPLIKNDFGSEKKAYWYFSQCGKNIEFKDPMTKRKSGRILSVPSNKEGGTIAEGFTMAKERYPFAIGGNNESYISREDYLRLYQCTEDKTAYVPLKHRDALLAIYALYRIVAITPGKCRYLVNIMRSYDVSISISGEHGTYLCGNSRGTWHLNIDSYKDIFSCMDINAEKFSI